MSPPPPHFTPSPLIRSGRRRRRARMADDNSSRNGKSRSRKNSEKSKQSTSRGGKSRGSKRSSTSKKKSKRDEGALGPPSDKEMKDLMKKGEGEGKAKGEGTEEDKKEAAEAEEKKTPAPEEEKEEKKEDNKEESNVVEGIQAGENTPLLTTEEDKTKEGTSGQDLLPGEARQSMSGMRGADLRKVSYVTIIVLAVEAMLTVAAFVVAFLGGIPSGPRTLISINLGILLISCLSLIIVLLARLHVSTFETDAQYKYVVTCARRFLMFSSHSIRFFLSLSTLCMALLLTPDPHWPLFALSLPTSVLPLTHMAYALRKQTVLPSPC